MRLILLLSVIFFSTAAPAQTAVWKRFGVDEGLSSTTITAIIQSRDGIMWFGAQNGLTRFDGSSFKKVAVPKNEIQPYIQALAIDKNNLLWAGTRTGLWSYDKNTRQLVHHHYEGKHISNITALVFDSLSQKLYATTFEGTVIIDVDRFPQGVKRIGSSQHVGIQLIKNNFFTIHHSFFIKYNETRSDTLSEAIAYGKGFAWYKKEACFLLVSTSGICTIDTNGRMQKPDLNIDKSKLADESTFFIDRKDRLWINAMDTLYCFKSTS
ncbi:MAG: two-component regulator propeller domain-containing protein, partial [Bacteroidota bacterium]